MTIQNYDSILVPAAAGNGASIVWNGGRGVFAAFGTFGGGTMKLQFSVDNTTFIDVDRSGDTYVTFTTNGIGGFELPAGYLRVVNTGGTAAAVVATIGAVD